MKSTLALHPDAHGPAHREPCCRYEISTEGDSFQLAFHTPADAVGWCLDVQSLLLTAAWPAALEQHAKAALRCAPKAPEDGEQPCTRTSTLALQLSPKA